MWCTRFMEPAEGTDSRFKLQQEEASCETEQQGSPKAWICRSNKAAKSFKQQNWATRQPKASSCTTEQKGSPKLQTVQLRNKAAQSFKLYIFQNCETNRQNKTTVMVKKQQEQRNSNNSNNKVIYHRWLQTLSAFQYKGGESHNTQKLLAIYNLYERKNASTYLPFTYLISIIHTTVTNADYDRQTYNKGK